MVDKKSQRIICTAFSNGKRHDFRLFKESRTHLHSATRVVTDSAYQGLQKMHAQTQMPKKEAKRILSPKRIKETIDSFLQRESSMKMLSEV